jgi:hypothetical protein
MRGARERPGVGSLESTPETPHPPLLRCDQKLKSPSDDKCVALAEVVSITSGATSEVFKRTKLKYKYNAKTCLSVKGQARSLDLEFGSAAARDWIMDGLHELMESGG